MPRLAKAHKIGPDFFGRLNRQRVTGGIIFEAVEENSDDFAFQIKKWSAAFTALRWQIYSQVSGWKISAKTFTIEAGNHAEARRLRQVERITNRNDRSSDFKLIGVADWQRRTGQIHFQHRDPAPEISQQLARRIFFALKLNSDVFGFATDRISGVKRAGRIDKETGAGKFAVLIGCLDLDYRFGSARKDIFDFAAKRSGGLRCLLRGKRSRRGERREC